MCKFRIGICPLRIETGRYEVVNRSKKGLLAKDRLCQCCDLHEVEDEYHFLMRCTAYSPFSVRLWHVVQDVLGVPDNVVHDLGLDRNTVLFARIMQCDDKQVIHGIANFLWDAFKYRETKLLSRLV